MFLKSLKIDSNTGLIRLILFHKGINLIIDETSSSNKTESWNSVGKTTVLRLIDYCLGGTGKNIYTDPEFKSNNKKIENFLKDEEKNVTVTLVLTDNLDDEEANKIIIERNFLARKKKIQKINGISQTNDEFLGDLKKLIFHSESERPSIKELVSKNIRDEKNKLTNTLKVLSQWTTNVEYELLFLFWLWIDVDAWKNELIRDKNLEERIQARYRKDTTLSQINQSLILITKEIAELDAKRMTFNLNPKYEEDLSKFNRTKFDINVLSTNLSRLELRRELILESKAGLEKDISNIDTEQIKRMYDKARMLIPSIQRTFEDTLIFHNGMIQQKIKFITEELPSLEFEITEKNRELTLLLIEEKKLSESLKKSWALEDLEAIMSASNIAHEKKGKLESQKALWESSNQKMKKIIDDLEAKSGENATKDEIIQERISKLNEYFSEISNKLDWESSLLSWDAIDGVYHFVIGNVDGNPGTGSKKSQMASFDLAYIKFADLLGIPCLHFILQDQFENVHANQIINLTEIVDSVNCQYVLAVLKDKLPTSDINIEPFKALWLNQSSKLFKV